MIVVDTSALISILVGEDDAAALATRMGSGEEIALSTATVLEATIVCQAKWGVVGGRKLNALLEEIGPTYLPFDARQLVIAREAYARYGRGSGHPARLNFGDCFSYALARALDAPLLFKGDDFIHTDVRSALQSPP